MSTLVVPKRSLKQTGFLLMEAILSIAVISAGTIFIMRTYATSLEAGVISQQYLIASNLAEQVITDTISQPQAQIVAGTTTGIFPAPYDSFTWEVSIEEQMPEIVEPEGLGEQDQDTTGTQEVKEKLPTYLLVTIKAKVSWLYRKNTKELTYQTAILKKQPEENLEEFEDDTAGTE